MRTEGARLRPRSWGPECICRTGWKGFEEKQIRPRVSSPRSGRPLARSPFAAVASGDGRASIPCPVQLGAHLPPPHLPSYTARRRSAVYVRVFPSNRHGRKGTSHAIMPADRRGDAMRLPSRESNHTRKARRKKWTALGARDLASPPLRAACSTYHTLARQLRSCSKRWHVFGAHILAIDAPARLSREKLRPSSCSVWLFAERVRVGLARR